METHLSVMKQIEITNALSDGFIYTWDNYKNFTVRDAL
jgi:hypothetical protein